MSHSSQNTKVEYADKHETNVAAKMANVWEQRIGSGKIHNSTTHSSSPSSVVRSSGSELNSAPGLTSEGSQKPFSRVNTEEIVKNFERMASLHKQESRKSVTPVARRTDSVLSTGMNGSGASKKNINEIIERICSRMNEVDRDLRELKSIVSDL